MVKIILELSDEEYLIFLDQFGHLISICKSVGVVESKKFTRDEFVSQVYNTKLPRWIKSVFVRNSHSRYVDNPEKKDRGMTENDIEGGFNKYAEKLLKTPYLLNSLYMIGPKKQAQILAALQEEFCDIEASE